MLYAGVYSNASRKCTNLPAQYVGMREICIC